MSRKFKPGPGGVMVDGTGRPIRTPKAMYMGLQRLMRPAKPQSKPRTENPKHKRKRRMTPWGRSREDDIW